MALLLAGTLAIHCPESAAPLVARQRGGDLEYPVGCQVSSARSPRLAVQEQLVLPVGQSRRAAAHARSDPLRRDGMRGSISCRTFSLP